MWLRSHRLRILIGRQLLQFDILCSLVVLAIGPSVAVCPHTSYVYAVDAVVVLAVVGQFAPNILCS